MAETRSRTDLALRRSRLWVAILAGTLIAALLLPVDPLSGELAGIGGWDCVLGSWLGEAACPGCGLTRSTALFAQGEWEAALALNAAGALVVLLSLGGIVVHGHALFTGRRSGGHDAWLRAGRWIFIVGLSVAWMWRLWAQPGLSQ